MGILDEIQNGNLTQVDPSKNPINLKNPNPRIDDPVKTEVAGPTNPNKTTTDSPSIPSAQGTGVSYDNVKANTMTGQYGYDASTSDRLSAPAAAQMGESWNTTMSATDPSAINQPGTIQSTAFGYTPSQATATGYNATLGEATGYNAALMNGAADYKPALANATTWEAYKREVAPNDLSLTHLNNMLASDSDYIKRARLAGEQYANSRGLLNTAMAAGMSHGAAIDRAAPIALNDSQVYDRRALADMQYTNQSRSENANNQTRVSLANAGFSNDASRFSGENTRADYAASNEANRSNAAFLNAQTLANQDALNQSDRFNAGAQNEFSIHNNSLTAQSLRDLALAQTDVSKFNAGQGNSMGMDWAGLLAGILQNNTEWQNRGRMQDTQLNQDSNKTNIKTKNDLASQEFAQNQQTEWKNTDAKNDASRDKSDKDYGKDQFNTETENRTNLHNADQGLDAQKFNANIEQAKWERNFQLEADQKLQKWDHEYDMEKLDYQKISNMQQDYVSTMRTVWNDASSKIQEIQLRNDITGEAKTQLINDAIYMRDQGLETLGAIYDQLPGWDESWNSLPDESGAIYLKGSAEAVAQHGAEVQAIFGEALGRNPSESDVAWYASKMAQGKSYEDIRREISHSPEAQQRQYNDESQYVAKLFADILGRNATNEDLTFYANEIISGNKTRDEVRKDLLGSDEIRTQRVASGNGRASDFVGDVTALYQNILGRDPDPEGLRNFTEAMARGMTREQAAQVMRNSDEFRGGR